METDASEQSYALDPESVAEMTRLINLDQLTTKAMGGPLAGLSSAHPYKHVLDLACGPGGWVLDVAYTLPETEVAGIDISQTMIAYANARARSQGLLNASFEVMDVTKPLPFSEQSFDLINGRLLVGVLSQAMWPSLLQECWRLLCPEGVLRLTDTDTLGLTNSSAFERLSELGARSAQRAGYGFSPDGRSYGITPLLGSLLRDTGFQQIQVAASAIDFSARTEAWTAMHRNYEILFEMMQFPLIKTQVATAEELAPLIQQAHIDLFSETFRGIWTFVSAWGSKR